MYGQQYPPALLRCLRHQLSSGHEVGLPFMIIICALYITNVNIDDDGASQLLN